MEKTKDQPRYTRRSKKEKPEYSHSDRLPMSLKPGEENDPRYKDLDKCKKSTNQGSTLTQNENICCKTKIYGDILHR